MTSPLKEKLRDLPSKPGIYQYKDKNGTIIYVGKAKNLKNRVKSYFSTKKHNAKTTALVEKIYDLELIITDNEIEALVLENNLIKNLKPRYNINLKDDKSFPYIKITNEPFPQIYYTREIVRDGSKYFGPFTEVKSMKNTLDLLKKIFKIRSCKYFIDQKVIEQKKVKLCLDFHIKRCNGPCEGLQSEVDYNKSVKQIIQILKGKTEEIIAELSDEMYNLSKNLKFEDAAEIRDRIEQLRVYSNKQKVVTADNIDRDIIAIASEDKDAACTILNIRNGKLIGKRQFHLVIKMEDNLSRILSAAIRFYYNEYVDIPNEIICESLPEDDEFLLGWLTAKEEKAVKFVIPQRESDKKSLLKMSTQNAILFLKEIQLQKMKKEGNIPHVLQSLKRDLRLKKIPKRIECFDISNLQGTDSVASMVVFVDGKPKKSDYRKFIIKTVEGPNDFASMEEVIFRRYSKLIEENTDFPELIMVDGGKGQLSSAVSILTKIGKKDQEIIGLAKQLEEVFLPEESDSIIIPRTSSSIRLLQHIRDEAHRFAITFHRERRSKRTITTELSKIKGIGGKIAEKLLIKFGSVKNIKAQTLENLTEIIGKAKAQIIFDYFKKS